MKLTILLLILIIVSCGKQKDSPTTQILATQTSPRDLNNGTIYNPRVIDQVTCKDSKSCPDYLLKVVVKNKRQIDECIGVHYKVDDSSYVITSSSCLDSIYQYTTDECSIISVVPASAKKEKSIKCDSIIQVTQNGRYNTEYWNSDILIFKLSETLDNSSVTFAPNKDYSKLTTIKTWIGDKSTNNQTTFSSEDCDIINGSFINPLSEKSKRESLVLSGCDISDLSRGAPLLNEKGEFVGILSNRVKLEKLPINRSEVIPDNIEDMFFGFTLRCVNLKTLKLPLNNYRCIPPRLKKIKTSHTRMALRRNIDLSYFEGEVNPEINEMKEFFKWDLNYKNIENVVYASVMPTCIYNSDYWLSSFRRRDCNHTYNKNLIHYKVSIKFDEFLRAKTFWKEQDFDYNINFCPKNIRKFGTTNAHMFSENAGINKVINNLKKCE